MVELSHICFDSE